MKYYRQYTALHLCVMQRIKNRIHCRQCGCSRPETDCSLQSLTNTDIPWSRLLTNLICLVSGSRSETHSQISPLYNSWFLDRLICLTPSGQDMIAHFILYSTLRYYEVENCTAIYSIVQNGIVLFITMKLLQ